ncbi:transcription factor E2FC-like isoform X1 [Hibiscus syriacus]|uniref:Transcription factor E2FC-like isoform X1 n=2 Tax=Hibiscus syriacus TaxID=106335 RepID=A0A6A3BET4_HIBSY|nr:transcription factor E2FC-like isoform X1 [Hibiscus syriacus]
MDIVMINTNRAEIDTTPPFTSVKEAVALFGDTVLAGQIYASKLNQQMHGEATEKGASRLVTVTAELEETKYNLEKAREGSMVMANCLCSLKEELERTKRELELMKEGDIKKPMMEFEMDDVRIVPGSARYELDETITFDEGTPEFQKKRYVTFANQPSLTRVIGPQGVEKLDRHPSLRKKKKPLISLIGGLFSKKK